jgi:hypothetical protein
MYRGQHLWFEVGKLANVSAYPGKVDTNIGFTRYWRIEMRKSETSYLHGFPKRICANV